MDLCCVLYYFFWYIVNIYVGVVQFFGFNQCIFLVVYSCVVDGGDIVAVVVDGDVIIVFSYDKVFLLLIIVIVV